MANRRARLYELRKMKLTTVGGKSYDIRDIVTDFSYHESIESPFIRADFTIIDAIDFNLLLQGGEIIDLEIETKSSKGDPLEVKLKVFKIGSIIKSERGQMYILHCSTPHIYKNELKKVFKSFGPMKGAVNKPNIPKHLVQKYWEAGDRVKSKYFENHSTINFISPNWKVTDAISHISDKVSRLKGGKGSAKQTGFLFFENKKSFVFYSIDGLCEGAIDGAEKFEYKLVQQGADPPEDGMYAIESVQYPDKADHLRNMRLGTYKSLTIGISMPKITNTQTTDSGNRDKRGTINPPKQIDYKQVFSLASNIESKPPYELTEEIEDAAPTRLHIRNLPYMKNQEGSADPGAGTKSDIDTQMVALYASARYSLLKSIQLTIVIPGNTALCAGQIIKIVIPASRQTPGEDPVAGTTGKVEEDKRYSGKYLIAGVSHTWEKEGITTQLVLTRDSVKE